MIMSSIPEQVLTTLLDASFKALVLAALAGAITFSLRIQNRNLLHRLWLALLLAMLALPALSALVPTIPLQVLANDSASASVSATELATSSTLQKVFEELPPLSPPTSEMDVASTSARDSPSNASHPSWYRSVSWSSLLGGIYLVGLALGLANLSFGFVGIHRLVRSSHAVEPAGHDGSLTAESSSVQVPLTVGVWRPRILLPANWNTWQPSMLRAVLKHEQTHIDRRDYLVGLLAELNSCVYWFHPLAWFLKLRLSKLAEQVCDDLVITQLGDRPGYAESLLHVAAQLATGGRRTSSLGVPMARTSQLESRVSAILDSERPLAKQLSWRVALLLSAIATSLACLGAGLRAEEKPAETQFAAPAVETLFKTVRVVNSAGEPIAGATVVPWAIHTARGHGTWNTSGYGKSEPPSLTTNEQGEVTLPFPRYANPAEKIPPRSLTCRISHPDYADSTYNDADVRAERIESLATFTLLPGAKIEISASANGQPLPHDHLYALWNGYTGNDRELDDSGHLKLPQLPAGPTLFRLVYLPPDGERLFSKVKHLRLKDGEHLELEFDLKPGLTVQGKLDNSVPRPVKAGRVVGEVLDFYPSDKPDSSKKYADDAFYTSLQWRVWAAINADGTFELNGLPAGDLQLIGLCEGFRAANGTAPDFAKELPNKASSLERPQVFEIDESGAEVTLEMNPAAECRIEVVGPDQQPVVGAECNFWPNVHWWRGGSQIYCAPLYASEELLQNPGQLQEILADRSNGLYSAKTNSYGLAVVGGLPSGSNDFNVQHARYELPLAENNQRSGEINLVAGEQGSIKVLLQPKGTEFVGDRLQKEEKQEQSAKTNDSATLNSNSLPLSNIQATLPGLILLATTLDGNLSAGTPSTYSMISVDPNSGAWTKLFNMPEGAGVPTISQDGRFAFFRYYQQERRGILMLDTAGNSSPKHLSDHSGKVAYDGNSHSIFISNRDLSEIYNRMREGDNQQDSDGETSSFTIHLAEQPPPGHWRVMLDDGEETQLDIPLEYEIEDCSPDGEWLVATTMQNLHGENTSGDLYLMKSDGSQRRKLTSHGGFCSHPRFSPDGKHIAYCHSGKLKFVNVRRASVRILNLTTGVDRVLIKHDNKMNDGQPEPPIRWYYYPTWSPDGGWLAVSMVRKEKIVEFDLQTTRSVLLISKEGSQSKELELQPGASNTIGTQRLHWQ